MRAISKRVLLLAFPHTTHFLQTSNCHRVLFTCRPHIMQMSLSSLLTVHGHSSSCATIVYCASIGATWHPSQSFCLEQKRIRIVAATRSSEQHCHHICYICWCLVASLPTTPPEVTHSTNYQCARPCESDRTHARLFLRPVNRCGWPASVGYPWVSPTFCADAQLKRLVCRTSLMLPNKATGKRRRKRTATARLKLVTWSTTEDKAITDGWGKVWTRLSSPQEYQESSCSLLSFSPPTSTSRGTDVKRAMA